MGRGLIGAEQSACLKGGLTGTEREAGVEPDRGLKGAELAEQRGRGEAWLRWRPGGA